ncbi:MAG: hypothetical protein PHG35_09025 [Dehalococcoidales bacterium]|nr:hypothetical protein [Dehalococcoidales bacterium]
MDKEIAVMLHIHLNLPLIDLKIHTVQPQALAQKKIFTRRQAVEISVDNEELNELLGSWQ